MKFELSRRQIALAGLGCVLPAVSWSVDGAVALPIGADTGMPELKISGRTRLTVWGFRVYDAQLWVGPGFTQAAPTKSAFIVDLTYLRKLNGAEIAKRSLSEMQGQAPVDDESAKRWLDFMMQTFPDVGANDRLLGIHKPGGPTRFVLNGREIGRINDAVFAERFFGIWLSKQSSEPAMREALVAGVK